MRLQKFWRVAEKTLLLSIGENVKLYNFYHLWVDGEWRVPLQEHIAALEDSLLYANLEKVYIGLVGNNTNRSLAKNFLQTNAGTKYEIIVEKESGFEQVTQDAMVDFAQNNDGYVFYNHGKGSSNNVTFEHEWRKELNHVFIFEWKKCVEQLQRASIVGTYYLIPNLTASEERLRNLRKDTAFQVKNTKFIDTVESDQEGHFTGNFFWTHLKYVKALGYPDRVATTKDPYLKYADDRIGAELWTKGLKKAVEAMGDKYLAYDMHKSFLFESLNHPRPEHYNQNVYKAYIATEGV